MVNDAGYLQLATLADMEDELTEPHSLSEEVLRQILTQQSVGEDEIANQVESLFSVLGEVVYVVEDDHIWLIVLLADGQTGYVRADAVDWLSLAIGVETEAVADGLNSWPLPELDHEMRGLRCVVSNLYGNAFGVPLGQGGLTAVYFADCLYTTANGEEALLEGIPLATYRSSAAGATTFDFLVYGWPVNRERPGSISDLYAAGRLEQLGLGVGSEVYLTIGVPQPDIGDSHSDYLDGHTTLEQAAIDNFAASGDPSLLMTDNFVPIDVLWTHP